jgi:hypothetical protein
MFQQLYCRFSLISESSQIPKLLTLRRNKVDIASQREVSIEEAQKFARKLKWPYFETRSIHSRSWYRVA